MITGDAALNYAENGTAAVATYSATDPESALSPGPWRVTTLATSRSAPVASSPSRARPTYEAPADADTDNSLRGYGEGLDGTNEDTLDVTVTVTDVDEDVAPADPLKDKYDANDNDEIERSEVFAAIEDYLDGGAGAPTRADVFRLIDLYLGD